MQNEKKNKLMNWYVHCDEISTSKQIAELVQTYTKDCEYIEDFVISQKRNHREWIKSTSVDFKNVQGSTNSLPTPMKCKNCILRGA